MSSPDTNINLELIVNKAKQFNINEKLISYLLQKELTLSQKQKETFIDMLDGIHRIEKNAQVSSTQ